jgi:hypothetical protein
MSAVCPKGVTPYSGRAMTPALALHPVLAANDAAFAVLFSIFVAAMLVMIVITIRWTIRRDKAGRAAWRARREGESPPAPGP